ncbi:MULTISPECIES: 2,3-diphosphoglycerate-dependent phosphoglycerate mutase [Metallosphaera]|uniref:2,3-diphosphoglycerate-dependent phosphoglycerate mutase n=1 Tax=Metallosphaera TaxID=41980 RepID=UPI001F05FB86|nr:2,3-diphosphoglycerate-dependent phosphoglycerate mutase [Metallosphaera sedula]MCH1772261.1 2,3-diphosphoglycerate-dependent phosphoglycerate mutase [Metallosphaera sedula]MCP6728372.1 2,3-diphosphoglycerate-dependent phosphoglycerate mutase [Metallosphaera sedula]BBL46789.1 2,3-bisphosphoglycerate-dependent phosphoglycerate mutase [Metallosphaera sedula]
MTIIIFIRHGQSTSNVGKILSHDVNNFPLTDEGREQAKKTAQELKRVRIDAIFTSPILRAYQTASIIGDELGIIPVIDERLRERWLGELNNKRFDPNDHWKLKIIRGQLEVKNLEPWDSLRRRMVEFVTSLKNEGVVVAVSHYDPIRAVIGHILDLDDISAHGISIPNASMTVIEFSSSPKILSIGSPVLSPSLLSKLDRYIIRAQDTG